MRTHTHSLVFAFFLISFMACGAQADTRVEQLDDPDYPTRLEATEALLLDESLDFEALKSLVPLAKSLEQRYRLLRIARHHTLRRLRLEQFPDRGAGAVGVHYPKTAGNNTADEYILVNSVLAGFPAAGRLRPMDRLTAINGQRLKGPGKEELLQKVISGLGAGQSVTLSVMRDGEALEMVVPLASGQALAAMYQKAGQNRLAQAFQRAWLEVRSQHFASLFEEPR